MAKKLKKTKKVITTIGLPQEDYYQFCCPDPVRYPCNQLLASEQLIMRGYAATVFTLSNLVTTRKLEAVPDKTAAWTEERIEKAAHILEEGQRWNIQAAFLATCDLTMFHYWESMHRAYQEAIDECGHAALPFMGPRPHPVHFLMLIAAAVCINGKEVAAGRITFLLHPEVEKAIKASKKTTKAEKPYQDLATMYR